MRLLLLLALLAAPAFAAERPPNVVVIFADDLGYSDLGCFDAKGWTTPHLDSLAKDGVRFTSFLVSQPVCSASRASLLTGCYANRVGIHGALGPNATHGLAATETTLASLCKSKGYATGMVGKWHLGHRPQFLPTKRGFDSYLGLPYSNDMWPKHPSAKPGTYPKLPMFDGDKVIDAEVGEEDQAQLTKRYTERAVRFIDENKAKPFFLYVAHSMPHVPIFASENFKGSSKQGLYGDVIQEIDWSAGEILKALKAHDLERDTLVVFTSDNGPWLSYGNHAGTKRPLREGKGSVWEGGIREPAVARWPGKIPAGTVQTEPLMTIDILPTVAKLIGAELPKLPIDGKDVWPLFVGEKGAKSPHAAYWLYYGTNELQAIRSGKWKLILPHSCRMIEDRAPGMDGKPAGYKQVKLRQMLFDLDADIGETTDVSDKHPDALKMMLAHAEAARAELGDSLTKRTGKGTRQPDRVTK